MARVRELGAPPISVMRMTLLVHAKQDGRAFGDEFRVEDDRPIASSGRVAYVASTANGLDGDPLRLEPRLELGRRDRATLRGELHVGALEQLAGGQVLLAHRSDSTVRVALLSSWTVRARQGPA